MRSNTFLGKAKGLDPKDVNVPVVGGHSGITIIPAFSQSKPKVSLKDDEVKSLTKMVQVAGDEVRFLRKNDSQYLQVYFILYYR